MNIPKYTVAIAYKEDDDDFPGSESGDTKCSGCIISV